MALCDITEYDKLARDASGAIIQTGGEPAAVQQQVAVAGASAQSAAFSLATRFVRVHSDVPTRILFGANPTAVATSMRIAAGATEYFGVIPGQKIAVILTT